MSSTNVLEVPSGLCCRTIASKADFDAVTHASRGPYSERTWQYNHSCYFCLRYSFRGGQKDVLWQIKQPSHFISYAT